MHPGASAPGEGGAFHDEPAAVLQLRRQGGRARRGAALGAVQLRGGGGHARQPLRDVPRRRGRRGLARAARRVQRRQRRRQQQQQHCGGARRWRWWGGGGGAARGTSCVAHCSWSPQNCAAAAAQASVRQDVDGKCVAGQSGLPGVAADCPLGAIHVPKLLATAVLRVGAHLHVHLQPDVRHLDHRYARGWRRQCFRSQSGSRTLCVGWVALCIQYFCPRLFGRTLLLACLAAAAQPHVGLCVTATYGLVRHNSSGSGAQPLLPRCGAHGPPAAQAVRVHRSALLGCYGRCPGRGILGVAHAYLHGARSVPTLEAAEPLRHSVPSPPAAHAQRYEPSDVSSVRLPHRPGHHPRLRPGAALRREVYAGWR
mmetsp:Transcript_57534/g.186936  ORF Transcript_57534/g.186936 Transcript_57534/m.186936 type:complete len:369 (-) Transcript_57534:1265-2371(-)